MGTVEEKMQLNIDKSSWKLVKFGDVVFEPKAVAKNLQDEGIQHVVGLEHIDTEDIHLKRFASIEESTTFTKKFAKGDVLFGRRRAYLKKAAQAPFGGICSGDITVFRAKNDLLPALLPFVVNNDKFFDHAIKHSAGGLSPRVKFKDLANYEFLLPPKDQRAQVAELLWAMDEVVQKQVELQIKIKTCLMSFRLNFIGKLADKTHAIVQIKDIGTKKKQAVQVGPFGGSVNSRHFVPSGVPVIKINNINEEGELDLSNLVFISKEHTSSLKRYCIESGDLLTAAQATTGRTVIADSRIEGSIISQHLIRISADDTLCHPEYLYEVFSSDLIKNQINLVKAKTTRDGLNTDDVANFWIPLPSLNLQRNFVNKMAIIRESVKIGNAQLNTSIRLQKSIINSIF